MSLSSSLYPRLLGDIGGTHARFAWRERPGAELSHVATYPCQAHDSLRAAIERYLTDQHRPQPAACGIGIANPVLGDRVQMTNHSWSFSIAALREELAVQQVRVVNDFSALALSLPALLPGDLEAVGGGVAQPGATCALIGPGTGLGVSGLLYAPDGATWPVPGEGGHATLVAADPDEAAVIELLRRRFGHVSAERALSGPGLVNLYCAVAQQGGRPIDDLTPADVVARSVAQGDPDCARAVALFFSFLGSMSGNLALTLGARGGVYIGGGIVPRLLPQLQASRFRERFEAKGRFRSYLAEIPCRVIVADVSPALTGACRALDLPTF